jgi:hypothetical protein
MESTQDILIIKPEVSATVPVQIIRGSDRQFEHITQGQFVRGNDLPKAIEQRFDLWDNLAGEEVRTINLEKESTIESTGYGLGEVQVHPDEKAGAKEETVVNVVFSDGHSQKYLMDEENNVVRAPVGTDPQRDDEAKLLFQCYLDLSDIRELTFITRQRDLRRKNESVGEAVKEAVKDSLVTAPDGTKVEADAEGSPLSDVL